jgi:alginate O-acetyltransferase complex protein AlgI
MAFSSNFFIFGFLPAVLAVYFLAPHRYRNGVLLFASLLFYAFDAGWLAWILIVSIFLNYAAAKYLAAPGGVARRSMFVAAVIANLGLLLHYKYSGLLWDSFAPLFAWVGISVGRAPQIELPIGISFFTFQALSYIADVYARRTEPARTVLDFGAYHSLFPQLIAGPIVRYVEIKDDLYARRGSVAGAADGLFRFCIGLGKKLILADPLGGVADQIFKLPQNELTAAIAWVGLVCYTLQIYYDFSGYSDMAIGLGKALGFDFPENFNQPYRARNITEFWRRWHMTLSRWFRDYVYIPLGGNRRGPWRTYRNLVVVFFLCGLWHGAAYTFVIWGLYHGALLVIERLYSARFGAMPYGPLAWPVTFFLIAIGWVFFRSPDLAYAVHYLAVLFHLQEGGVVYYGLGSFLTVRTLTFMLCGLYFALYPFESYSLRIGDSVPEFSVKAAAALLIFVYSVARLSANGFNPFIYFRF